MLEPLAKHRWDHAAAMHLLHRAGFGGTPAEVTAFERLGVEGAVDRLLADWKGAGGAPGPEWAKPDPERIRKVASLAGAGEAERKAMRREMQAQQRDRVQDLRCWWLTRMVSVGNPLEERMVLFWHGHFATSIQKVKDPYLMYVQNQTFRRHAAGRWRDLLMEVTRDPAMLVWLDQAQSRRESPNENYAREVMELFALGEGHFNERDVREAARAFTGLGVDRVRQEAAWRPRVHDDGVKQVLGRTGRLKPEDVIDQIVAQPQASRFLCAKLWRHFVSDDLPKGALDELVSTFERHDRRVAPALRRMFTSAAFYSAEVVRAQIKSPVQWLVTSLRHLERPVPAGERALLALKQLGQDLFAPPNVKGWDGGVAWINTSTLTLRQQYASVLVLGREGLVEGRSGPRAEALRQRMARRGRRQEEMDAEDQVQRWFGKATPGRDEVLQGLARRFLQDTLRPRLKDDLLEILGEDAQPDPRAVVRAVAAVMRSTDYQLT